MSYNKSKVDSMLNGKVDLHDYAELNAGEFATEPVAKNIFTVNKGYNSTIRFGAYCTGTYTWCYPAIQMSRNDLDTERVSVVFSPDGTILFLDNNNQIIRQI